MTERIGPIPNGVTWKWIVGVLISILFLAGGVIVRGQDERLDRIERTQEKQQKAAEDVEVVKERARRLEDDVREIKGDIKDQNRKLDEIRELLRRGKP